jgi:type ISP restriction-modification system protein
LAGHEERLEAVIDDKKPVVEPTRYGFRFLDRQWIVPDARLINQPNPTIWKTHSPRQVYLTALEAHAPSSGPAVTFTGLIPDLHHYKGSFGGRAYPLWHERSTTQPNIKPALLAHLAKVYGEPVRAEDMMAYLAAIMAHPAFTARFKADLLPPCPNTPPICSTCCMCSAGSSRWNRPKPIC